MIAVSGGYPEAYKKGMKIEGLASVKDSIVFHAGTKELKGEVVSNGGRVLAFTSYGQGFKEAIETSYSNLENVHFNGMYFRKDIGFDL